MKWLTVCFMFISITKPYLEIFFFLLGLKDGIARIARTFGDKLLAFKFPPRVAQKLQGFLDYC